MFKATNGGAVELYYDNSRRIETHTQGAAIASGAMTMPAMNSFSSQILVGNSGFIGNYHDGTTNQQLIVGTNQYFDSAYKTRTNATAAHIQFYERTFRFNTAAAPGSAGGTLTQEQALRIDTDGIKFGTDTAAANALDDYEEGSWQPTIGGNNMSVNHAHYTKIGNFVHLDFDITGTASANGNTIAGLPFTAVEYSAFHFGWVSDSSGGSQNTTSMQGGLLSSAGFTPRTAGGNVNMNVANGQRVIGCAQYRTAS